MTRIYDENRPVNLLRSPVAIAEDRASRFEDPLDRNRFMEAFTQARIARARGDQRLYLWYREALDKDDSVRLAGLIHGAASINKGRMVW